MTDVSATLAGRNILILEDEVIISMDLRQTFEDRGAAVACAMDPDTALDQIDQAAPDGAVLDVNLGGGRTCEPVAHALRRRGVPFVLHSGDLDRHGELIGGLDAPIVAKPASGDDVARAVERLLAMRQAAE